MIGKDPLISTAGLHLVADKQTIKQELREKSDMFFNYCDILSSLAIILSY